MKRTAIVPIILAILVLTPGCLGPLIVNGGADDQPLPAGLAYTSVRWTDAEASQRDAPAESPKVGTSEATAVLGVIGFGDASVTAAAKNADIEVVHRVDHEILMILGLFITYKTIVYGE